MSEEWGRDSSTSLPFVQDDMWLGASVRSGWHGGKKDGWFQTSPYGMVVRFGKSRRAVREPPVRVRMFSGTGITPIQTFPHWRGSCTRLRGHWLFAGTRRVGMTGGGIVAKIEVY